MPEPHVPIEACTTTPHTQPGTQRTPVSAAGAGGPGLHQWPPHPRHKRHGTRDCRTVNRTCNNISLKACHYHAFPRKQSVRPRSQPPLPYTHAQGTRQRQQAAFTYSTALRATANMPEGWSWGKGFTQSHDQFTAPLSLPYMRTLRRRWGARARRSTNSRASSSPRTVTRSFPASWQSTSATGAHTAAHATWGHSARTTPRWHYPSSPTHHP
jgi:hypothetical protein